MSFQEQSVVAQPGTDVWRKPPHTDIFNVFSSACLTFSATWTNRYDQAGLLLLLRPAYSAPDQPPAKWIKTGVEFYMDAPQLSTVVCERWADWSVAPAPPSSAFHKRVTIMIKAEQDEHGKSLWVYHVDHEGAKSPLREICGVYGDDGVDWQLEVGYMAARPDRNATDDLKVDFHNFEVHMKEL
ncbi:hypothetical protein TD95_000178 [Thielaviopsis punctulata]|uniref:Uncharacterized protein n=1 Tax=Thielaviopsis punctulata TaxID=72032 RepID=A0A0F4ZCV1_9PEZI|nr:hypothetical protein TD95_000178 [Thielaviopsis punctulata]